MKIVLVGKTNIVGKDKREWVKASYIKVLDGTIGTIFCSKQVFDGFGISDDKYVDDEVFTDFIKASPVVEADFDERGTLLAVS